jgi:large subunit ribosomal protein LP2
VSERINVTAASSSSSSSGCCLLLVLVNKNSKMSEVAALLLCKVGGKSGTAAEITAVMEAAGLEVNEESLTALLGDMEGKDINELLTAGQEKIKDVPYGGGGGGGAGAGGDVAEVAKVEEPEVEEEMDMGGGGMDMFGGDEGEKTGDY